MVTQVGNENDAIWGAMRRVIGEPPPVPPFDEEEMARLSALVKEDLARLEALLQEEDETWQEFENKVPQDLIEKLKQHMYQVSD